MSDRQQRILDAAIEVLGTRGLRQLTHRAVDEQASLPIGSTSNRFRTREALLAGVLSRILERETVMWTRLSSQLGPLDIRGFARAVGALVAELTREGRAITLARHAVFIEAAHQPALQRQIAASEQQLVGWAAPLMAALGSQRPAADLRLLLSFIDGMLVNQLANPEPEFDPAAAIATVLPAILRGEQP